MEIHDLEVLVKQFLINGQKYVSHKCENLLPSGENYGSVMLKVEMKVLSDKNKEEIIHCVAKCPPPNEYLWEYFRTKLTFKKEIGLYNTVVPIINEFGKEKGIDNIFEFFAKPLGTRISLNSKSDVVDKDAVILLENLKVQGYDSFDRIHGFDLETTKLILKDLAVFHAAPLAYKLAKPEEFKTKLMPYLNRDFEFCFEKSYTDGMKAQLRKAASKNPACIPVLFKIDEGMDNFFAFPQTPPKYNEPFATIVHQDLWTNNILIKMVNGKPVKSKMVDFQLMEYNSPVHDVIFFLYSSVELSVLQRETDNLIKYYYDAFIETLNKLNCDFCAITFETFTNEIALVAKERQFSHLLFMLMPLFTLKDQSKELSDFDEEAMNLDLNAMHPNFFKRLQFILLDFVNREWI